MLDTPTHFSFNGLAIEVNWNSEVTPCKQIRFTIDGKTVVIPREEFYKLMVFFADQEQIVDLIPIRQTNIQMVRRILRIRAKKNIKAGEFINVPYEYPVATEIVEKFLFDNPDVIKGKQQLDERLRRDILKQPQKLK